MLLQMSAPPDIKDMKTEVRGDDDETGDYSEEKKPKPDKDVDFFIDNIEWKNAERVVFFYISRCTKLMESTFCHPGENVYHRIYPVFLISVSKGHHFNAVREECSIKKPIQKEHLT